MGNLSIFKNSRVIVTGHTGFKGSWLTAWLKQLGANIMGISLDLPTNPSHFKVSNVGKNIKDVRLDIRDRKKLENKIINTLINEKYISSLQHAGDMGIELCKAEIALKNNFKYIQDKDLNLK